MSVRHGEAPANHAWPSSTPVSSIHVAGPRGRQRGGDIGERDWLSGGRASRDVGEKKPRGRSADEPGDEAGLCWALLGFDGERRVEWRWWHRDAPEAAEAREWLRRDPEGSGGQGSEV